MKNFKKLFLVSYLIIILSTSFQSTTYAANFFGIKDPPGCESKDSIFPSLLICGRSKATGACEAYTKPCSIGDFVETGSRALIWMITLVLLIVPLFIMYYGAMMIINRSADTGGVKLAEIKEKFWHILIYFILLLSAWMIVRTVVDVFQVKDNINTFLIDENGNTVKAKNFDMSR